MPHDERHEELVCLAALGVVGQEREAFERQLAEGCLDCETLLPELRLVSSALAAGVRPRTPRPEVRERVLSSLGPARPEARPAASPVAAWFLAAAASLLFVVIAFDDARLRREREELSSRTAQLTSRLEQSERDLARRDLRVRVLESEDVRMLFLGGQGPQPQARAKVFWSEKAKRGVLVAGNLEALPPDKQYELWVFDRGKPVAAGVFDVDASGRALFESPDLSGVSAAQNFAVTIEPRGGVPQPTGPIVLVGKPT